MLNTGIATEMLERVKWADGTDFVFHINILPVKGSMDKKMLGEYAVNLSVKYAAEKKLKELNDWLLLLTRTTTDAIWEWDIQTGYIFRNDALRPFFIMEPSLFRLHPEKAAWSS